MSHENQNILILFGSETGNAQDVAEKICQDAQRRHFQTEVSEMDQFSVKNLPAQGLVIFVCSTAGQGEEPENMKNFWKFLLKRNLPRNSLQNLQVAVLGLGDSSYQKFNFAAKKLFRRLTQLGAAALIPVGLADDQHDLGYDGIAEPWIHDLWEKIDALYPLPPGLHRIPDDELLPPKYRMHSTKEQTKMQDRGRSANQYLAPLISCERVTAQNHFQDTRLIKLDISNTDIHYTPGDVAVIQPQNLTESVSKFIELLGLSDAELDADFWLEPNDSGTGLPPEWIVGSPTSLRKCLETYLDLQCTPRRSFFRLLSHFANSELEKEKLVEFSCAENQEDLFAYCNRPRRSVVEVLEDFHETAAKIPKEYLFDLFTPIRPRAFSIASCESVHKREMELLLAVVQYKTRLAAPRLGLCSNWLSRLSIGAKVPLSIRKGTIRFPESSESCLMIGPGTGIAPFRSFVQDRRAKDFKENLLFFGCRNKLSDFYFKKEWEKLEKEKFLILKCAFSRDQGNKVYVQHKIKENSALVWNWIKDDQAYIFVAGNSKEMPQAVIEALGSVATKEGGMEKGEADIFVENLEKKGKLQMETWS